MTPTAATTPSLLLGLLLAATRPSPCLAWARGAAGSGIHPGLLLSPTHRRPLSGASAVTTVAQQQQQQLQQRRQWGSSASALGAAATASGGADGDGEAASKPARKRRTSSTNTDDALAAGAAAATKAKAAPAKKKPAAKADAAASKGKKATSASASATTKKAAAKPVFQPNPQWREQLDGIRRMREEGPAAEAPVDWAGCSELGLRNATSERHARFRTMISSMMSSQTTDIVNEGAMRRLDEACGITIEGLESLGEEAIAAIIKPVSFYTPKAQNILKVCNILKEKYDGDIPRTFEELMELPGIGPKMATLIMEYGWGETVGITVDTHVHRISNRLGWADTWNHKNPKAQNPEKTRKLLESWLPKEHWKEVNPLMVGLGQTVCRAIAPKCLECKITTLCPSYIPPEACL